MDAIAMLKDELSQLEAETFELEAVLAPDGSNLAAADGCTSTSSCSSSCCSCTSTSS